MKPKFLWFRISTAFGLLLGLLLLVQTLRTYYYVSQGMVRIEAQREADRRMQSIGRAARLTGSREPATLAPVLRDLVRESPQQLAWIRILDIDGKVLAETEKVAGAPVYKPGQLGKMLEERGRRPEERDTRSGSVLIVVNPLRFGPPVFIKPPDGAAPRIALPAPDPDGRGQRGGRGPGRGAPQLAEIALYFDGVSANFLPLRENLIVGCSAAFALMAAVIVIALRFRHYMRGRHIEEELSLARRVQNDLFPAENSLTSSLAFAAKCVPAYQVGGDLYDVFETDDGEVGLVLGDVSGKGLPAALLMGVVQGAVRASCITGPASNHEQSAERLNHLLCMKTARERFVSLFWCYFDRRAAVLRYVNAGHLPPLLIRQNGASQEVRRLDSGGPVLGLLPGARYIQA
ncbi:MAG: SpoIIE family protein phosphatase, partial [Acidobacteriota bacterium]